MNWAIRAVVGLWGLFFLWTGVTGVVSSDVYAEIFGITGDAAVMNTVRADLSSFFIVSGLSAGWVALRPEMHRLLLVPAALFGIAMLGRILGVLMGDPFAGAVSQSILVEGLSLVLLLGAQRLLARDSAAAAAA